MDSPLINVLRGVPRTRIVSSSITPSKATTNVGSMGRNVPRQVGIRGDSTA